MTKDEIKARAWDSLMEYFRRNGKCLSYREAVRATGGVAHLEALLADRKISEMPNEGDAPNSKRMFPADEVYAHIRAYN